ncbi:Alpha-glucosidase [Cyphellophora attinorum]|uniref:Alpha-glucosidase n=1 Tax=Cyphellophora attinorum TaxID=1664694 RepID=A0A0N1HG79_9EURO|nr:Alpha-glucosidase [Phialophora attinorum]KPI34356.1 Alpha-glucosidase [Phialophora attinorum]
MACLTKSTHNPLAHHQSKPPTRAWWKEASIYQIYPASFATHPNQTVNHGTIRGIISKLPYIRKLGVDAIWLCPIYASPQKDMGYDISDYRAIHPPYGTLEDVEELIGTAHGMGLKVIMDLVVNHTSDQHAWFRSSRRREGDKGDWYIWRDAKVDSTTGQRKPPNNWASMFGGSAWSWDEVRQQYYLALFTPEQPDLNWENPDVVEAVHDVMHYWLKKGVDGFRMDVINMISKEPGLPDAEVVWEGKEWQPGAKWFAYGPRLNEYLRGLRKVLDDIVDMDIGSGTKFSPRTWDANTLKAIVNRWQTFMWDVDGWNALFLENHDQARSVSRFTIHRPEHRELAAKMLATFIACQQGTLYVYQGQELGMTNLPKTWGPEEYKDIETQNLYKEAEADLARTGDKEAFEVVLGEMRKKARDHARSPVQWTGQEGGGFEVADGQKPWMRMNDNYKEINAAKQEGEEGSVLNYWRKLLKVRKEYKDTFVYGRFEMVLDGSEKVIAYKRVEEDGVVAFVVLNFVDEDVQWQAPKEFQEALKSGKEVLGTYSGAPVVKDKVLVLRPFEVRVALVGDSK